MEVLIFIAGAFLGAIGMFILFFWLGTSERFKKYDAPGAPYYQAKPICTEGHKWCPDHAAKGIYHCTECPYSIGPDNGGAR